MQTLVFGKTSEGLPTTTQIADLSDRTTDVTYTNSAFWGPLEARISLAGTFEEGFTFAEQYLGNPVEIWSPDGQWCWEGIIWTVRLGSGNRRRSRSLEGYAAWGQVFYTALSPITYTPISGAPWAITVGEHLLSPLYPSFIANIGGPWTEAAALARANAALAQRQRMLWLPDSSGTYPGSADVPQIEIECLGWYRTLWYAPHPRFTNEFWDVATIIRQILEFSGPYVSSDQSNMDVSTLDATRNYFDKYETAGELIKRLTQSAGGAFPEQEYLFGLLQGRVPYLRRSKRLSGTVDYLEHIDGTITDAGGAEVPPWAVRADTILRQVDFAPPSGSTAVAVDSIENIYLSSVSYSSSRADPLSYQSSVPGILGEIES